MKTVKISLANIQGKLSRVEMKSIMPGSGDYKLVLRILIAILAVDVIHKLLKHVCVVK